MLEFDDRNVRLHNTICGSQSSTYTKFNYDADLRLLTFKPHDGSLENISIYEISAADGRRLIEPVPWQKLCDGLKNKSKRVYLWCVDKGIKPEPILEH